MVPIKTYKLITFMQFSKIEMTYYIVIKKSLEQGSPMSKPWTSTSYPITGGIRLEIKSTINVIFLNHPQSILTYWSVENCLA